MSINSQIAVLLSTGTSPRQIMSVKDICNLYGCCERTAYDIIKEIKLAQALPAKHPLTISVFLDTKKNLFTTEQVNQAMLYTDLAKHYPDCKDFKSLIQSYKKSAA